MKHIVSLSFGCFICNISCHRSFSTGMLLVRRKRICLAAGFHVEIRAGAGAGVGLRFPRRPRRPRSGRRRSEDGADRRASHWARVPVCGSQASQPPPLLLLLHLSARAGMARRAASRAVGSEGSIQGRGGRAGGNGAEDARHVFDELLRRGKGATIYGLNRALDDVARHSPAAAVSRYNRMARAGADEVTPNLCTYGILIGSCCCAGRLDLGFAALGNVIKKGFRVEAITFTPLLKGLCADKRTSDAMDIVLCRMTQLGCIPNVFSCTILLKGLCDENRSQEALELLQMMPDDGGDCPPDVVLYNTVINGFFKEGDPDKAYATYHEMFDQGILPDVVTYSSIIAALCKAQAMDKAMEVLNTMVKNGVMPNCRTYNSIVHGYCSSGQLTEAIGFLKMMCSDGVEPDVVTCNLLMDYLCKNRRCTEARKIFNSMTKCGLKPDITTYCTLLQGYATKGALVEMHDLLDLMVWNGIQPNHHVFNILICAYAKQEKVDEAMLVFSKMRQQGLSPNAVNYRTVIDVLCKLGRVYDAVLTLKQMINEGLTPDIIVYTPLIHGFCTCDKWEKAEELIF